MFNKLKFKFIVKNIIYLLFFINFNVFAENQTITLELNNNKKDLEKTINKENLNIEDKKEPEYYAYVGLGEDSSSKILHKSYRRDFYRYNHLLDNWVKLKRFPGGRRTNAICFILNGQAYVGCGQDDGDANLQISERFREDIFKYNPQKDTWSAIRNFPLCLRKDMITFVLNSDAYIGLGHIGAKNFSDIYKYDTINNKWIKAFEYESKQNPKLVFTIDNKLYLGGTNFFCLDSNDEWKQLKDIPEGNNSEVVFTIKGKAYIGFGGIIEKNKKSKKKKRRKQKKNIKDNLFYCYDIKENKWNKISPFPGKARRDCATFTLDNKGYVGLGQDNDGNFYKEFYCYDPETDRWNKIADLPSKSRINSVAFVLKNKEFEKENIKSS